MVQRVRGEGGRMNHLVAAVMLFVGGFFVLRVSFILADKPYDSHTWESRGLYIAAGILSVLLLGFAVYQFDLWAHVHVLQAVGQEVTE